ncbi:MAG: alpha-glucosidase C-terminal domain-containing protein [Lentimicrobiaceae bacterium]|jgi:maltose alpha-D-glucosyltransferase/alpha-amylase|nr:alpha-glucosidase C-terminal domain-containing protein [Lentimicrobiaceae bacterium]
MKDTLKNIWEQLYPTSDIGLLETFLNELGSKKHALKAEHPDWYKDAVVYALYVDLFAENFAELTKKLDYLQQLGVNCLWLLPILDSPMRDAGFDIRNYDRIRNDLLGLPENFTKSEQEEIFENFLNEAHSRGLRVIFDIALNHVSDTHPWFQQAITEPENPYRDYFIWSDDTSRYSGARVIFKGIETSNWEPFGNTNYFHRFFSFQPDLNYRNPHLLLDMLRNFIYWQQIGVDGFRVDAIPYLWKEEGTDCENLPQTHLIMKFFRLVLDSLKQDTLLLAEACQHPKKVVEYFGNGDECQGAYHFPLMPMIFKAIAKHDTEPIVTILNRNTTPEIPANCQWFTFLRCHDELSLELVYVSESDRKYIHDTYCRKPEWDFRQGEGISARLANLMEYDERRIGLAYSIMATLQGTPVIYYGDEFGKENDEAFYKEMTAYTGKDDTRFLVRGKIDWKLLEKQLKDETSFQSNVLKRLKTILKVRKKHPAFGRGTLEFKPLKNTDNTTNPHVLAYTRTFGNDQLLIVQNLSNRPQNVLVDFGKNLKELLSHHVFDSEMIAIAPYAYYWFSI